MDKRTINEMVNFFTKSLSSTGISVGHIALFGSVLKGVDTKDSDVDFIVISDDFEGKDIFERSTMMMNAELQLLKKYKIPFDILNMTKQEYQESIDNKRYESQLVY